MAVALTYHEVDGLLYPDIQMPEEQEKKLTSLGKYGMMALKYLQENEKQRFRTLQRFGMLAEKMHQVDEEAIFQGYKLAFPENSSELDEWMLGEDEYKDW